MAAEADKLGLTGGLGECLRVDLMQLVEAGEDLGFDKVVAVGVGCWGAGALVVDSVQLGAAAELAVYDTW